MIALALTLASPDAKPWTVFGVGNRTCGRWTLDHREQNDEYTSELAWLGGFLTALNHESVLDAHANLTDDTDMPAATGWIDNYCIAHPLDRLATAAESLALELRKRAER